MSFTFSAFSAFTSDVCIYLDCWLVDLGIFPITFFRYPVKVRYLLTLSPVHYTQDAVMFQCSSTLSPRKIRTADGVGIRYFFVCQYYRANYSNHPMIIDCSDTMLSSNIRSAHPPCKESRILLKNDGNPISLQERAEARAITNSLRARFVLVNKLCL